MARTIEEVTSEAKVRECFPVMAQLRPTLTEDEFVERAIRQFDQGYHLLRLLDDGIVRAVSGYRFGESLGHGRFLYVDDLVADEMHRSQGAGGLLFDRIVEIARSAGCDELRLDCGVHRFDAHRFYMRKRMSLTTHHFLMKLNG